MAGRGDALEPVNVTVEVDRFFDDSSLSADSQPQLALICGPVATGKTRHRRSKYANGYVVLDAGEIFISLSRGEYVDFPSFLEEPMDLIGATIARRALRERRHIVTEVIGHQAEATSQLIDAMLAAGYKANVEYVSKDLEGALEWNAARSDNNISAYFTEPFHRRWLVGAAAEATLRRV